MSEIINNSAQRKEMLKHLILQLHHNEAPEIVRKRITELLQSIPYNEVVEVEQELIAEGLPEAEVLRLCDIHTDVLEGNIDTSTAKQVPQGHPVDTFKCENRALENFIEAANVLFDHVALVDDQAVRNYLLELKGVFNALSDVDKHYKRKEYLLFPFLEKNGITGPPTVMWGKHDETREMLKNAHEVLMTEGVKASELITLINMVLRPAVEAVAGMIMKEEEILLPMALDVLSDENWYQIYQETGEYGYCLYDPEVEWKPENVVAQQPVYQPSGAIRLSSGSFAVEELEALFVTLPVDLTFVDKNDKVRFFSHSPKRVFERNRSIIGRDVRLCHPPHSVHIVEQIISDFKAGKENKAAFWISSFKGRFIYIEYTALRGVDNEYLGVIEVTQDITDLRNLEGDQRLLSYSKE